MHKREIKRYGFCAWCVIVGAATHWWAGAWIGLGAAAVMYAFDRWGRPFAERGKAVMKPQKPSEDQEKAP